MQTLMVYSIFKSIDGECNSAGQGALTIFIRLAGCNLRCQYPCDTQYSFNVDPFMKMTIPSILEKVRSMGIRKVTITGGEPLLQMDSLLDLIMALKHEGYQISIETNGSLPWGRLIAANVDCIVADYKLPTSGMEDKMIGEENFAALGKSDFVKFVIMSRKDFNRAIMIHRRLKLAGCIATFAFSPVHGVLSPVLLLKWMMKSKLDGGILNIQLHKILGLKEDA
jgi:7-carboxy-7-deazaguanine synthase